MHKKIFARHPEVALRIIRRHATLISKSKANRLPRTIMRLCRNPAINRGWRVAARERDPKLVALGDASARLLQNEGSGVSNEILSPDYSRVVLHSSIRFSLLKGDG